MFGKKPAHKNELMIPPIAASDPNGVEILRAWTANSGLHVTLAPNSWDDSRLWGIAIADIIRHLADAFNQTQGKDQSETIEGILNLLHAELDSPTDTPTGAFADRN